MNYWLFKTEPDEFGIDDLQSRGRERWDGIRNYQARNLLRDQVRCGDQVLIYHSSCKAVGVAGIAGVVSEPYADPAQFDPDSKYFDPKASPEAPRWFALDVGFVEKFPRVLPLARIKSQPQLAEMVLIRQGRLSVQPVTAAEWQLLTTLARQG
ncbi:EVE domain-containing protein [Pseudomaricurvus sp. HS19]|uniref:EVE domain-containing protein n=1 Tax=Pseudomaricurvus sp. HS19 TaxID=2692626 RepID=UPI00136C519C|nr:EVE domain-containing protein [Pseudomaricurvus sp. HS19]MYM64158.1 EVE domain-containing protein [Pseudomaricurvus sp. HS19]